MKNIIIIAVMLLSAVAAKAQFTKVELQASGLTCAMCAKSIFKNLQTLNFAEKIDTDLNSSTFVIVVKEGANVDPDQIRKKVEDAGFAVAALTLKGKFSNLDVASDGHFKYGGQTFHFLGADGKSISGEGSFTLVDKSFVSDKEYKKFSKATKMECFKTGYAASCCQKDGVAPQTRIYHVII